MELKINHLSKHFKDKKAVDDVCLTLTAGVGGGGDCSALMVPEKPRSCV